MSVARGFGLNGKSYYTNICKPEVVQVEFTVTATNGLGVTSVKSNGYVRNVFMHTSTTPTANDGVTNPNPLAGYGLIQFKNNFNYYVNGYSGMVSPSTGSIKIDNSAMTAGQVYVISTLGNATLAKWVAIGVPVGVTPAVGVSFVAASNGGAGNTLTSRVSTPSVSSVGSVELIGDPNTMIANSNIASNGGAYVFFQFLTPSGSGTIAAPTFTGSAMDTHAHDLLVKGGQIASTTNDVATYATSILGKQEAADVTIAGSASATKGGVIAVTAGTPAGTISAPVFTSTSVWAVGNPADGSIVKMSFFFDASSVTIDGL